MRINNNLMAMNTHRQLGMNSANGAKSIEKLSSGYRINRAGDDAAGLSISEKMRGQIRGLNQASRNAQDGISLIQTAEGALNETHAILQRMRELSVQSANDTNVNIDRTALQGEMDELAKEITRISNNTEFNTQKLVNGGITATKFHVGANAGQDLTLAIKAMDAFSLGVAGSSVNVTLAGTGDVTAATVTGSAAAVVDANVITATTTTRAAVAGTGTSAAMGAGNTFTITATGSGASGNIAFATSVGGAAAPSASFDGTTLTIAMGTTQTNNVATQIQSAIQALATSNGVDFSAWTVAGAGDFGNATGVAAAVGGVGTITGGADAGLDMVFTDTAGSTTSTVAISATATSVTGTGDFAGVSLTLDGTNANGNVNTLTLALTSGSAAVINADGTVTAGNEAQADAGIDITSQANASAAITTINAAIETVSAERSKLGAVQNRLEHTIKNLDTSAENLQASESRIRDVDMAKEMMEFTKNNILQQAAQAMLAQANQAPQGVLQLLR